MRGQAGFFDIDERLKDISAKGDDLEPLNAIIDFEAFRADLAKAVPRSDGSKGGRPPFDHVFMLFHAYEAALTKAGFLAMGGQIIDATIVSAPKQRNIDGEKADIRAGRIPAGWKDKPAKLAQKDRDARWTVKFSKAKPPDDGQQISHPIGEAIGSNLKFHATPTKPSTLPDWSAIAMPKALSIDLRTRIAAAVKGGETVRSAAIRFGVSAATAVRMGQKARAGTDLTPRPRGAPPTPIIKGELAQWVRARLEEKRDLTTRDLAAEVRTRGTRVTHDTVWRFIRSEGLTFKKKLSWPVNRTGPERNSILPLTETP